MNTLNSYGLADDAAFYDVVDSLLHRRYYVAPSSIHGTGSFAARDLEIGEVIGVMHEIVLYGMHYHHTLLGISTNHSTTPNCVLVTYNNRRYLAPLKSIKRDEELTLNYEDTPSDLEKSPEKFGSVN